ncbi:hypothetical protein FSARC_354 [Fusarium sarcochroum]|uniref:Uncharacterized protein n=1 Tax=Fusarium sarcochroum TaxID=1208366 RepID=A0A8H4UBT5_9HYPO|nr:hypothetical protein FSARC_354 [Fusarium sarcochroum]
MEIRFRVPRTAQVQRTSSQKPENQPSTLAFVNVNNPTQMKEKATQRKIRRHVMKDIGLSRRMGTIHYDTSALSEMQPIFWGDYNVCINFRCLFEAMDMVSEGLMAIAVLDPALNFQRKLDEQLRSPETVDEMKQYTESLSLVRTSITPESQAGQYAVIGTVICLAVFDMRVGNTEKWKMHMAGLERIVELGGGVEVLESCLAIRQSLFITDVLGSMVMDARPRFPLPQSCSALPNVARLRYVQRLLASLQKSDPTDKAPLFIIDSAFRSASQLVTLLSRVGGVSPLALNLMLPVQEDKKIQGDKRLYHPTPLPRQWRS